MREKGSKSVSQRQPGRDRDTERDWGGKSRGAGLGSWALEPRRRPQAPLPPWGSGLRLPSSRFTFRAPLPRNNAETRGVRDRTGRVGPDSSSAQPGSGRSWTCPSRRRLPSLSRLVRLAACHVTLSPSLTYPQNTSHTFPTKLSPSLRAHTLIHSPHTTPPHTHAPPPPEPPHPAACLSPPDPHTMPAPSHGLPATPPYPRR